MTLPELISVYFETQLGPNDQALIMNSETPKQLRDWSQEDSNNLAAWLQTQAPSPEPRDTPPQERLCHNVAQAAATVGVGPHTIQAWISRDNNPLPHIRDHRRIIIPHFLLVEWLREEANRTITPPGPEYIQHQGSNGASARQMDLITTNAGAPDYTGAGASAGEYSK